MALTKTPTSLFSSAFIPSEKAIVSASVFRYGFKVSSPFSIPAAIFIGTSVPSLLNSAFCTQTERVNPPPPGNAPL